MKRPQKFTIEITANEKDLVVKIDNSVEGDPAEAPKNPSRKRSPAKKKTGGRKR